jgi:hypothetical protein
MTVMGTGRAISHDLTYVWNVPVEHTEAKMKSGHQEQSVGVGVGKILVKVCKISAEL